MKKVVVLFLTALAMSVYAETIVIKSQYNAQHAGHAALYKIMEEANKSQLQYNFILELKPGGQGVVALKDMDRTPATSLALINAAYVQNTIDHTVNEDDYTPVASLGDACWFIAANVGNEKQGIKSLASVTELLVAGAPGIGSATHLLTMEISEKLNRPIRFISFKSAGEANIIIAGNNGVHIGVMSQHEFANLKTQNPKLQRLAVHCDRRMSSAPTIATSKEQGINSPYVFNTILASVNMPQAKLHEIKTILNAAIRSVGQEQILALSDFSPPNFKNQSVEDYHREKMHSMKHALAKHRAEIESAK